MNEEPLAETWATRDMPVLRAALRRLDAGEDFADVELIRAELDLTPPQMLQALRALEYAEPPYIEWTFRNGWTESRSAGTVDVVFERARRELGTWPTAASVVDDLAAQLEAAAEAEREPERRGRLRAASETLAGAARDLAVQVVAARLGKL